MARTLSYMFRGQRFQAWLDVKPLVEVLGGDVEDMKRRWLNTARTTSLPLQTIANVEQER
ncbi:hypothetical protein [Streptomyces sp. NPDC048200]|uniref:hypothetical protein n=1 Tax=Streptomyces sp. NPDC048200 TaxID=3365512 RepID=UPI003720932E